MPKPVRRELFPKLADGRETGRRPESHVSPTTTDEPCLSRRAPGLPTAADVARLPAICPDVRLSAPGTDGAGAGQPEDTPAVSGDADGVPGDAGPAECVPRVSGLSGRVPEPHPASETDDPRGLAAPSAADGTGDLRIGRVPWSVLQGRLIDVTSEGLAWIRDSIPKLARHVRGHGSNVRSQFWSEKNRLIVPCESRTVERVLFISLELDTRVAWYLPQPAHLTLSYRDARGRRQQTGKIFDALVGLVGGEVFVAEFRGEDRLQRQLRDEAHLYRRDGDVVRYVPYAETAKRFGIPGRVVTPAGLPKMAIRNWEFLKGYERRRVREADFTSVREAARDRPRTVIEVAHGAGVPVDVVFAAVARGMVYVDVNASLVVETETTLVHASFETFVAYADDPARPSTDVGLVAGLRDGTAASWDGRPVEVVQVGKADVLVRWEEDRRMLEVPIGDFERFLRNGTIVPSVVGSPPDPTGEALARSNQAERDFATESVRVVRLVLDGQLSKVEAAELLGVRSVRTVERRVSAYRSSGWAGCVPDWRARGNRRCLAPERELAVAEAIRTYYTGENGEAKPKRTMEAAYKLYRDDVTDPVSLATFKRRIRRQAGVQQTLHRDGDRAANRVRTALGADPFVGLYPFHVIQVDATLADLFLWLFESVVGSDAFLMRPLVSVAVDVYSRCVVGVHVSLGGESAATALMLLRDVVRRHGRMADIVLMDNGPGYRSNDMRNFIVGICRRELQHRAPHRPQIGGVCERLLETMRAELLVSMAGQTARLKAVREVTKEMDPRRDAAWTLAAFTKILEHFFFEVYNRRVHPHVDLEPARKLEQGYLLRGCREQQRVVFDRNLVAATSPSCGARRIDPKLGVWANYNRFRNHEVSKQFHGRGDRKLEVRWEPEDCTLVRVLVDREWVDFVSDDRELLLSFSERDRVAVSKAYHTVKADVRRQRRKSSFGVGKFLSGIHRAQEALLKGQEARRGRGPGDRPAGADGPPAATEREPGACPSLSFLDRDRERSGEDV